jgi:hypothetical protein
MSYWKTFCSFFLPNKLPILVTSAVVEQAPRHVYKQKTRIRVEVLDGTDYYFPEYSAFLPGYGEIWYSLFMALEECPGIYDEFTSDMSKARKAIDKHIQKGNRTPIIYPENQNV